VPRKSALFAAAFQAPVEVHDQNVSATPTGMPRLAAFTFVKQLLMIAAVLSVTPNCEPNSFPQINAIMLPGYCLTVEMAVEITCSLLLPSALREMIPYTLNPFRTRDPTK